MGISIFCGWSGVKYCTFTQLHLVNNLSYFTHPTSQTETGFCFLILTETCWMLDLIIIQHGKNSGYILFIFYTRKVCLLWDTLSFTNLEYWSVMRQRSIHLHSSEIGCKSIQGGFGAEQLTEVHLLRTTTPPTSASSSTPGTSFCPGISYVKLQTMEMSIN